MRGQKGEWIREAADAEKREENIIMIKLLSSIIWLIQIMSVLTDAVLRFLYPNDYTVGIYERTKPAIFKDEYNRDGTPNRGKSIKELQQTILKDKKLWD